MILLKISTGECNLKELHEFKNNYKGGFKTFIATLTDWYISTFSTTSTLRLPVYILSAVDAYQKAYGTAKRVMMVVHHHVKRTYVLYKI
jgi:hypothetical protein